MKKLIFGTLFLALVGIGGFSCKKNHEIKTLSKTENTFESQKNELQNILKDLNSEEKDGPGWWDRQLVSVMVVVVLVLECVPLA
jgi:hypothetical protein